MGFTWDDALRQWPHKDSFQTNSPNYYILMLFRPEGVLCYGRVDYVKEGRVFIEIAEGVFLSLLVNDPNLIWTFVADADLEKARKVFDSVSASAPRILELISEKGIIALVTKSSYDRLYGGARITQGLKNLGGELGMRGGIIVIAGAPSLLTAKAIYDICSIVENNSITPAVVAGASVAGAGTGVVVILGMVSEAGSVGGLSAAGITSGLAALGEGAGMVAGLVRVAVHASLITVLVGGVAWFITHNMVQDDLAKRKNKLVDFAVKLGFKILIDKPVGKSSGGGQGSGARGAFKVSLPVVALLGQRLLFPTRGSFTGSKSCPAAIKLTPRVAGRSSSALMVQRSPFLLVPKTGGPMILSCGYM